MDTGVMSGSDLAHGGTQAPLFDVRAWVNDFDQVSAYERAMRCPLARRRGRRGGRRAEGRRRERSHGR
eukprot:59998-Rhodomonas_salina.3